MKRVVSVIAFTLACLSTTAPSSADDFDAAMARAAAAKEKAIDSGDVQAWLETYQLFAQADAIRSTKESKYELATAAVHMKADDVAFQAFEEAIALGLEGTAGDKAKAFVAEHAGAVGRLRVTGPAGTVVSVGGRKRGVLPLTKPLVVFAGTIVVSDGTRERKVTIEAGKESTLDLEPPPEAPPPPPPPGDTPPRSQTVAWTLIGVGAATTIVGIVGYVTAQRTIDARRDSLAETCTGAHEKDYCIDTRPEYLGFAQSDGDAIATWKAVRIASVVAAGAGLVIGTIGVFDLGRSRVSPTVGLAPGALSFALSGRF